MNGMDLWEVSKGKNIRWTRDEGKAGRALLAFSLLVFLPLLYNLSLTGSFFSLLSAGLGFL